MTLLFSPARAALSGAACLVVLWSAAPADAVEVERVVSPGGIEAWLVENPDVPVIAVEFAFEGGVALDPPGKEGLANLVSVLLDEGAGELESAEFQQRLADAAIGLGFDAGVDAFYGSLKTTSAYAEEAFELLRLALSEPRFDPEPVERMRQAILAEIRRRVADPEWMSRRVFYDIAFPGHPYARPSRGTVPTLSGLTIKDLRGFVRDRFTRDNLVIGVSGDITAAELGPVLDQVFGGLPESGPAAEVPETTLQGQGEVVLVERAGPQSIMLVAQQGVDRQDPDYYAATVLNFILGGGGFGSRLTDQIREARGLTYGISSYFADFDKADLLLVSSDLSNANVPEALELLRGEWRRMAAAGVTAEELADAKTFLTGSFPLQFTSTDDVAQILVGMQIQELGIDYLDRRNNLIETVTIEDVNRVARELLDADALTAVVVGSPDPEALKPTRRIDAAAIVGRELGQAPTDANDTPAAQPAGRS